jgi:sodium/hydrogen exchanger-like protein 3
VFIFAKICNFWRFKQLTLKDKLIMSYGGIRGAVAFALALILDEKIIPTKKEFITATTAVVFFTVFFQGITIAPIVKYLHVALKKVEEPNEMSKLSEHMIEYIMSAFEGINGNLGDNQLRIK